MTATTNTHMLQRPGGRIAYEVSGEGPLVVCIPGMGELRSSYRFVAPALIEAGFRVAAMDLRGHGDSDATFDRYDDVAAGQDALALVDHLGGPAVLVGNSMGAGAAVWAAAERPDAVSSLVLTGPFVHNPKLNPLMLLAFRAMIFGPWAARMWLAYYPKFYPLRRPDDLAEYMTRVRENLRRPGSRKAFVATTRTSHAPAEQRLDEVAGRPAMVVMGEKDPDFPDAPAEGRWVADRLRAELLLVPGAGHYPHVETPEVVTPAVVRFCRTVTARA
jgi:pimeloyl-ACP methyl ester carboxylesterase